MSIENDNSTIEIVISPKANCVVSYSLNNDQPVRSTHIGNQPLFYMEFEESYDEDENFIDAFAEEIEDFNSEILNLEKQISKYDQISRRFVKDANWREELLKDNISDLVNGQTYKFDLVNVLNKLQKSRMFAEHYAFALDNKVSVKISDQTKNSAFCREDNIIYLNANLSEEDAILLLAKEVRTFWQKHNGTHINPLNFHPDQAIVVNRAQIADLNVFMVRVAWELQLAEEQSIWEYIEHSSLADIGRAYAREACTDFRTMNNGEAAQAAFEAWFLSERCRKADKILIQQMLSEYNGYVFGEDSAASKTIAFELLSKLGEQCYGKNYLQPYVNVILNDPVFTEVRDRSNANFLWFIKFERSFKEAEQELQSQDPSNNTGLQDSNNDQSKQNVFFINDETTEQRNKVIQFKPKS